MECTFFGHSKRCNILLLLFYRVKINSNSYWQNLLVLLLFLLLLLLLLLLSLVKNFAIKNIYIAVAIPINDKDGILIKVNENKRIYK